MSGQVLHSASVRGSGRDAATDAARETVGCTVSLAVFGMAGMAVEEGE
ncbi:hypothetical protein [Paenibacillus sp. MBLB4367]